MPSHILFYATRNDLLPILHEAEKSEEIKYVQFGGFEHPNPKFFLSATAIPDLGKSSSSSSTGSTTFLICKKTEVIRPREVSGPRYLFDQLLNPTTVTFTPGGFWGEDVLLHGRFATASSDAISLQLMKLYRALVRKRFEKIKAFYVGEEAARMLNQGKRLTIAVQSPQMFDLSRA